MLYLISTPIGNLSDISFRAIETMKACDLLLCEDTRRSQILLNHYDIKKKLESYHSFNESQKNSRVLNLLKEGLTIGLLSDGGCPAICDPGESLTKACIKENIPFTVIPGPAALIQALILSGFPCEPFQFFGFMPRKEGEILSLLPLVLSFPGTSIFYESPNRLKDSLNYLATLAPDTPVAVARELTKTFEEVIRMTALEAVSYFTKTPPKGEIVLLIQGGSDPFSDKDPKSLTLELQNTYGLSLTEAIKVTSHLLKTPKQSVYKLFHSEK
ncbi:MAG: 16S rRNA (cytidine(1402)-2'-O)-methyltransferase [Verrucomicrobia bacterium]|nr:16S rRNA (cytidine(1402)-2'-O)-methyltransferase [Verrucomicrobiota bacterium]